MKQSQPCSDGYRGCCSNTAPSEMRILCGHNNVSFSRICWLQVMSRDCQAKTKLLCRSPIHAIKVEGSPQASVCLHWAPELYFWLYALLTHREPWTRLLYQPRAVEGLWILPWIHYPVSPQALFLEEGLTCPGEELNGRNVYISRLPVSALKVNLTISLFQHHYRSYCFEFHIRCQLGSLWFVCSSTPHAILLDCLAQFLIFT